MLLWQLWCGVQASRGLAKMRSSLSGSRLSVSVAADGASIRGEEPPTLGSRALARASSAKQLATPAMDGRGTSGIRTPAHMVALGTLSGRRFTPLGEEAAASKSPRERAIHQGTELSPLSNRTVSHSLTTSEVDGGGGGAEDADEKGAALTEEHVNIVVE